MNTRGLNPSLKAPIQVIKQIQDRRMWYRGVIRTHPGKFKDPSQIRCEGIYLSFMLDLKEERTCKASL